MVDKEAEIDNKLNAVICKAVAGNLYLYKPETFYKNLDTDPDYWKILASNDPALSILPSLPEIEDVFSTEMARELLLKYWSPVVLPETAACKIGYKAASKQRMYSEEDMRKTFKAARKKDDFDGTYEYATFNCYAEALIKQPIAVEVEMQPILIVAKVDLKLPTFFNEVHASKFEPKVDSNNKIIVKRWVYPL